MKDDYFIEHTGELIARSEYSVTSTNFLTPAEQKAVFDSFPNYRSKTVFWGGTFSAERRCAFFIPDWLMDTARAENESLPSEGEMYQTEPFDESREKYAEALISDEDFASVIHPIHIDGSGFTSLSHRDYLGALMNLGIERETVGDIVLSDNGATVFCLSNTASLILSELNKIGRDGVKVRRISISEALSVRSERKFEERFCVISSLRLDCVVKECASVSREDAKRLISSGLVEHNYTVASEASAEVCEGDIVSVRGFGKFRFASVEGETRRERIRVKIQKYT